MGPDVTARIRTEASTRIAAATAPMSRRRFLSASAASVAETAEAAAERGEDGREAASEALDEMHFDRFETEQELLNALHPIFERYRERSAGGILAQLRSMLPF